MTITISYYKTSDIRSSGSSDRVEPSGGGPRTPKGYGQSGPMSLKGHKKLVPPSMREREHPWQRQTLTAPIIHSNDDDDDDSHTHTSLHLSNWSVMQQDIPNIFIHRVDYEQPTIHPSLHFCLPSYVYNRSMSMSMCMVVVMMMLVRGGWTPPRH